VADGHGPVATGPVQRRVGPPGSRLDPLGLTVFRIAPRKATPAAGGRVGCADRELGLYSGLPMRRPYCPRPDARSLGQYRRQPTGEIAAEPPQNPYVLRRVPPEPRGRSPAVREARSSPD